MSVQQSFFRLCWILGGGVLILSACAPDRVTLDVALRDAQSRSPVVGATIFADTSARDHPFSISTLLGNTGPRSDRALTDTQGVARITTIDDRSVRLGVFVPGSTPMFVQSDSAHHSSGWIVLGETSAMPGSGPNQIEILIERP